MPHTWPRCDFSCKWMMVRLVLFLSGCFRNVNKESQEHHLQRAISAQQVYGEKRDNMVIPVPEAERNITHYESLYPGEFKMPKQLIHIQPFGLDTEQPDYDLDSGDETFVNKLKKKMEITALQFEEMIDRLEKGSGQQFVSLQEAKLLLKEDDELIKEVFDYWSRKRKTCKFGTFVSNIKQEKRDGSSTSDPYVAFRRRTEKMQTRKNRKNDEASYEKMLKLRRDLSRAVTILEMIKRREKSKREMLHLTLEVVEKRNTMPDFGSEVMAEALAQQALVKPVYTIPIIPSANQYRHQDHLDMKDYKKQEKTEVVRTKRKYEKKPKIPPQSAPHHAGPSVFNLKDLNQYDFPSSDDEPLSQIHSGSSEAEEENDPDGCYAFRRKAGCHYYAASPGQSGSWPWVSPLEGGLGHPRFRYCLTSLNTPQRCVGLARRRVGRGGRFLLDRAHADLDAVCQYLDSDPQLDSLSSPLPGLPLRNSSTSETNTSDPTGSSRPLPSPSSSSSSSLSPTVTVDLNRILLNIKSCRWRHFRPRTLSQHAWGTGVSSLKGFGDFSRAISGLTRNLSGGSFPQNRTGPAVPGKMFTAEQYQQHQEQLAVMQKQQLEQSQHQQQHKKEQQQQQQQQQQQRLKEQKEQQRQQIQHAYNSLSGAAPIISQVSTSPPGTTHCPCTRETIRCPSVQVLVSKTLDQASAQFAASALVTADQLLTFKSKEELVLTSGVNGVLGAGVLKGLHLSSTATTLHPSHPSPTAAAPAFLQPPPHPAAPPPTANAVPLSLAAAPGNHAALGLLGCAPTGTAPAPATQVLIGNNICLSVPSTGNLAGRHLPRGLAGVPPSALKLSAATTLQKPKVPAAPSLDINSREKREEDKSSLNNIVDNTVAMEVT
ncbi:enhancer of polycomb homolog 1-like isoform X3 [Hippocampus zosterae]|uniref:enhancer of polycomb homolog 1-like isoform X3 n=1 Tax=Hippocampus zosterae TaxID=109293 RepID=UPI00223D62B4|nr:enhancer of polycomb homolog 1-like isoform X3 [Hippocampus zosterae]